MSSLKIRCRERTNASPKEGQRQSWTEWQLVDGRKVIGRFDLEHQAQQQLGYVRVTRAMAKQDSSNG